MSLNVLRATFVLGLVLAALSASSVVAWRFGHPPGLGQPLWWWLYDPLDVVAWGRRWGLAGPHRGDFLAALGLAVAPALVPLAAYRLRELYGPLRAAERPADEGLGRPADLLRSGHVARRGDGVVLGRAGRRVLRDHGDAHVLIMGATRSGKGAGHVVPTLLLHRGSVLAFDPKHELFAITGRRRSGLGPVFRFDPTDPHGAAFNPLLELRDGAKLVGDCQAAAHMLAHDGAGGSADAFWDQAAAHLLTALLVHVRTSGRPTLAHLWRLALDLDAGRYPASRDRFVVDVLEGHRAMDARVRSSINATLTTRLSFLADPVLQRLTDASVFRPSDLQAGDDPVTVYLSIPVAHARRLRPLTRLALQAMLAPLMDDLGRTADGRPKRRGVLALLDEFPQLGRLDLLEGGLAVCAGYGVRAALVCQDEDQIRAIYGPRQSITANCGTICVIPGFSHESLDTVARWGGERTALLGSRQRQPGALRPPSVGETEARVAVLNPRELLRRGKEEVLVLTTGCPPAWLRKARYYRDPEFRGLFDAAGEARA
jgi:type IV secretion system protein VirD4